jgi:hypothetical protein
VTILQSFVFARIATSGELLLAWGKSKVIAVMRSDYLYLVKTNLAVIIGFRLSR